MSFNSRAPGRNLAIVTVVGTVATLGYMYVAGKQTKREEGPASIYNQSKGLQSQTSDARLDSSGVRETVSGDRKP
ncbi:uncharacterized protein TRAVEDRAFT_51101 [Trametes versicolor FP-101664 SS1]|uniref:uncharacterized protein n=1 Tax=Trametes versicolor (strain FP-101664) TaxID=717944 RepID=UPI0004623762|nr:uncharacterized protein TRAVEDRAFT_51101 [Trametes versicolor FP-101664 SS1]EIW54973.1 hypothetical protein TRAVEDRAFT_51101 [Trametes versicolor FP-101664 SS1]